MPKTLKATIISAPNAEDSSKRIYHLHLVLNSQQHRIIKIIPMIKPVVISAYTIPVYVYSDKHKQMPSAHIMERRGTYTVDYYNEVPSKEAAEEAARKYHAQNAAEGQAETQAAPRRCAGCRRPVIRPFPPFFRPRSPIFIPVPPIAPLPPARPQAVRLTQEIIDGMKDIRLIFGQLSRMNTFGQAREIERLIAQKTRNIQIMRGVYRSLTGRQTFDYRPESVWGLGFCTGLRRAFLEQTSVIDKIARLNGLIFDPALRREINAVGGSELRALADIERLYARCK